MNKLELIRIISKNSNISLKQARTVVDIFLKTIYKAIKKGEEVKLRRFGRWYVKTTPTRNGYNIATKCIETFKEKKIVAFSPSSALKQSNCVKVRLTPDSILNPTSRQHDDSKKQLTISIYRSGPKINFETPNLGQRTNIHQNIESEELEYCGKTKYNKTEHANISDYSYPVLIIPFVDTPILNYKKNRYATEGVMEPVLANKLLNITKIEPHIQILRNISIPVKNRQYGYIPDIALIWSEKNLFIDIEIDEPYDLVSREPIHYTDCNDSLRNLYFLDNGWNIIRITEKQIVDDCKSVVKFIKNCIYQLTEDIRFYSDSEIKLEKYNRWSYSDAQKLATEHYREMYLGIERISTSSINYIQKYSTIQSKPEGDIISDRYMSIRNEINNTCKCGKYIIFTLATRCYDYVALSDKISFIQKNYEYGVELFDFIEEKLIFLRFQEISSFKSVESLTKSVIEEDSNIEDRKKILIDAMLNSNPIEIKYNTAGGGNPITRIVLFITFWYNYFKDSELREKLKPEELLSVGAQWKYKTLATKPILGYITGFCNYRKEIRTFNIERIVCGRVFAFRKNLYKIEQSDIRNMLQYGYYEIAINMYNELNKGEQKNLWNLVSYADILVMQGKYDEAHLIYKSIPAKTIMPNDTTTWEDTYAADFNYFISNNIKREEFEKIKSIINHTD